MQIPPPRPPRIETKLCSIATGWGAYNTGHVHGRQVEKISFYEHLNVILETVKHRLFNLIHPRARPKDTNGRPTHYTSFLAPFLE